jgi:hypothetical protein
LPPRYDSTSTSDDTSSTTLSNQQQQQQQQRRHRLRGLDDERLAAIDGRLSNIEALLQRLLDNVRFYDL